MTCAYIFLSCNILLTVWIKKICIWLYQVCLYQSLIGCARKVYILHLSHVECVKMKMEGTLSTQPHDSSNMCRVPFREFPSWHRPLWIQWCHNGHSLVLLWTNSLGNNEIKNTFNRNFNWSLCNICICIFLILCVLLKCNSAMDMSMQTWREVVYCYLAQLIKDVKLVTEVIPRWNTSCHLTSSFCIATSGLVATWMGDCLIGNAWCCRLLFPDVFYNSFINVLECLW